MTGRKSALARVRKETRRAWPSARPRPTGEFREPQRPLRGRRPETPIENPRLHGALYLVVVAWFAMFGTLQVAAFAALLFVPFLLFGAVRWVVSAPRRSLSRMGREHPDEPWLADAKWDPSGCRLAGTAPYHRLFRPVGAAVWYWFLLRSGGNPDIDLVVGVGLAAWFAWTGWSAHRQAGLGDTYVTYGRFPFHPGEAVDLTYGIGSSGGVFKRVTFTLRCVQGNGVKARILHTQTCLLSEHQSLPAPDTFTELRFELSPDAWGTHLDSADPICWELVVTGETSQGPFKGWYLIPIYDRAGECPESRRAWPSARAPAVGVAMDARRPVRGPGPLGLFPRNGLYQIALLVPLALGALFLVSAAGSYVPLIGLGAVLVTMVVSARRTRRGYAWQRERARLLSAAADEPWLRDHPWDRAGDRRSAPARLWSALWPGALLPFGAAAAYWVMFRGYAPPWVDVAVNVALAGWGCWALFRAVRRLRAGDAHITYGRSPFFPGEPVDLTFVVGAKGAEFRSARFVLRCVQGNSKLGTVLHQQEHVLGEHQSLPAPATPVELSFPLADDVWGTELFRADPCFWELVVTGDTVHGPYREWFLVPVYERPGAGEPR